VSVTAGGRELDVEVVIPTIGRPSLVRLLDSLAAAHGPAVRQVFLVDDRKDRQDPLLPAEVCAPEPRGPYLAAHTCGVGPEVCAPGHRGPHLGAHTSGWLAERVKVITGRAIGPGAARNDGWRCASATWVAFLDDDVAVPADWLQQLDADLSGLSDQVAASQGRIVVPLPDDRPPTDWERNVAGLESAQWATADMAYRRRVLAGVGGFDERFPRAYREDTDLGLRVTGAGWTIVTGDRHVVHRVPPAPWSVSLTKQAGNADDALMDRLHGRGWRDRAGAQPGRRPLHLLTTATVVAAGVALAGRRLRTAGAAALAWSAFTAEFTAKRLWPGPRTAPEAVSIAVTSSAIAPVASFHWLQGTWRARRLAPGRPAPPAVAAVLFDRDGTLVADVPYNGDPTLVRPLSGAAEALDRLRQGGVPVGIVSNQSGVGRGLITPEQVAAVNERVRELLGPFDVVTWCPHESADGCDCRKPAPGLVLDAAAQLGVQPEHVVVIGDIGADVAAAEAAGARGLLVPNEITRIEEVEACPSVFAHLGAAVDHLLEGRNVT